MSTSSRRTGLMTEARNLSERDFLEPSPKIVNFVTEKQETRQKPCGAAHEIEDSLILGGATTSAYL